MTHLGQRLSALIDGELDGAERDRVLVHLARCEPCRAEAVALRTLKRRMSALGETAADSSLTHRLIHLARPEDIFGVRRGPVTGTQWPGIAAAGQLPGRGRHEMRPIWYLAAGSVGVSLAGLATAAFVAGGPQQPPTPRVTPAVYTYLNQHEIDTGVEPATPPGPGKFARKSTTTHAP
jgi:anti-sigma factor RsiW